MNFIAIICERKTTSVPVIGKPMHVPAATDSSAGFFINGSGRSRAFASASAWAPNAIAGYSGKRHINPRHRGSVWFATNLLARQFTPRHRLNQL